MTAEVLLYMYLGNNSSVHVEVMQLNDKPFYVCRLLHSRSRSM